MQDLEQQPPIVEDGSPVVRTVLGDPVAGGDREPWRGGLPLGPTLGVIISVLVAALLGGLIAVQLGREERKERTAREALLAESLAPLAAEIEEASGPGEAEQLLKSSVSAEIGGGHPNFNLVLKSHDGRVVGSAPGPAGVSAPHEALQARVPVRSGWLGPGGGTLAAWQDSPEFTAEMAERRHAAWLDIAMTVLAVILVVQLTTYLLVTRPLDHLLTAIEKVEQGYPARLRTGDIARELRWLAWRFHHMSTSLTSSARLLVAAHRRAMEASKSRADSEFDPRQFDPLDLDRNERSASHDVLERYLRSRCALLESFEQGDPQAREIAVQMWEQDAVEAEKCGEMELRAQIESAALAILDPDAFNRVSRELDLLIASRADWFTATARFIETAFARDGLPLIAVQHRTKHAAGAWRKMQEKGLTLTDVHDLMAFRIIVPRRDDCYLALDIVHRLFDPEPFRFKDYIADPKANGYQSLHTSVCDRDGFIFEIQIRSLDMHRAAEAGAAAHWRYRASKSIRV